MSASIEQPRALTAAQIEQFVADGFVRIERAFSKETAADARAILWHDTGYVGLTRHKIDACVVAERDRLAAAVQQRQLDVGATPSELVIPDRLFTEARSYAEKVNVADRIDFMRTGQVELARDARSLSLSRGARAAQPIFRGSV